MKEIEVMTILPYNHKKLRAFFISPGVLRLFYNVRSLEQAGNLSYIINDRYNAIVYLSMTEVFWEIYDRGKLKDRIYIFLYPVGDNAGLRLKFMTNRILPLKKTLESEVKAGVELLRSLLSALR